MQKLFSFIIAVGVILLLVKASISSPISYSYHFFGKQKTITLSPLVIDFSKIGKSYHKEFVTKYGLDIVGGTSLIFDADTTKLAKEDIQSALESTRSVIERRVNFLGVTEPVVQSRKVDNKYRITVDLPGLTNAQEAAGLIGQTAQLEFFEIDPSLPPEATMSAKVNPFTKNTGLTGALVKKASVVFDNRTAQPSVELRFNNEGSALFADITKRNIGKQVAISLDGYPISAPVVQQEIIGGTAQITGNFTIEEAKQLATNINSGALPISITLVNTKVVGPTLGQKEVNASIYAGLVGFLLLCLFMIVLYNNFGVVAVLSLTFYALITYVVFRFIPVTLNLSGLAGFILSIGMAVDSNILIFERIKEETRNGKAFKQAVHDGFERALSAIRDANYTTLLVCFILFNPLNLSFLPQFGLVKGFALTLAIGVALSLFTGVVVTRRIIRFIFNV